MPGISGVTYSAETSGDLGIANWQPVPDLGSGTEYIFSIPVGNDSQIFMRLTVATPEGGKGGARTEGAGPLASLHVRRRCEISPPAG